MKKTCFVIAMVGSMACNSTIGGTHGDSAVIDTAQQDSGQPDTTPVVDTSVPETPVVESRLVVGLAATPTTTTVVRKSLDVPSVGYTFVAGERDVRLTALRTQSRVDTTGAFEARSDVSLLANCRLYDGTTPVSAAQLPDMTGQIAYLGLSFVIPRGTSRTLVEHCTVGDHFSLRPMGDRYALGINSMLDIVASTTDGSPLTVELTRDLQQQASGEPTHIVTVINHGTLAITRPSEMQRQHTILTTYDRTIWQNMATFRACAQYEDATIDALEVGTELDSTSLSEIGVWYSGGLAGSHIMSGEGEASARIFLSESMLRIPRDSCITFQSVARLAAIQASSTVSGLWNGAPRSGKWINLGLVAGLTASPWDSHYATQLNVHALGGVSGDVVYAPAPDGSLYGNRFQVRRAKPVVTPPPSLTGLVPGAYSQVFAFQESTEAPDSSIAQTRWTLRLVLVARASGSVEFRSFRLRRGSSLVADEAYAIVDASGRDLRHGDIGLRLTPVTALANVIVSFLPLHEEIVTGSGNLYTVEAIPVIDGSVAGDELVTTFEPEDGLEIDHPCFVTRDGPVALPSGDVVWGPILGCDISTTPPLMTLQTYNAAMIWSDLSEVPHSLPLPPELSSSDFASGLLVDELNFVQHRSF